MRELAVSFPLWDEAMAYHFTTSPRVFDNRPYYRKCDIGIHHMLSAIATFFISHCGLRDTFFAELEMPVPPLGQSFRFSSKRIDSDFTFGFDNKGFFIETDIRYPQHLKRMGDEFWLAVSSLHSVGNLDFMSNSGFSSSQAVQAAKQFKAHSSAVFGLIKNAVFFEIFEPRGLQDIGWFEVKWPIETSWRTLLENGLAAFCKLYRANYLLYRAEYVQSHCSQSKRIND